MLTLVFASVLLVCATALNEPIPILDGRIVGGSETTIEQYPHQVSLRYFFSHSCGGSIVNKNVILTAAHCVSNVYLPSLFFRVRAGVTNKKGSGVDMKVKSIHIHENYKKSTSDSDVAVLILAKDLEFSPTIQPIKMADFDEKIAVGKSVFVTGWGATSQGGFLSNILKVVEVSIISDSECSAAYANRITENMICAGRVGGGADSCQGDSGGPMITLDEENQQPKLIGVVSWGYGCAQPEYPGVYAKVSALRNWIKEKSTI